jgi:4-amino-4-deoxy-L-arabinose transferase-like glycosyltransferase
MKNRSIIILVGLVYLFSIFMSLDTIELRGAEPKRAIVSMEMVLNDQYVVPTIHNEIYFNKPPLYNWVQVFFFKVFGSFEEPVCRIPGIISIIIIGVLIYLMGNFLFDQKTGLFCSLFYLSSAELS